MPVPDILGILLSVYNPIVRPTYPHSADSKVRFLLIGDGERRNSLGHARRIVVHYRRWHGWGSQIINFKLETLNKIVTPTRTPLAWEFDQCS